MTPSEFIVSTKASIDKVAKALADSEGIGYVDLDDTAQAEALFSTQNTAIVLEFNVMEESPSDPMYQGVFNIGVRTVQDPANYATLLLVGKLKGIFPKSGRIALTDAYKPAETGEIGTLLPMESRVIPNQYDMASGIRLVQIPFHALRWV